MCTSDVNHANKRIGSVKATAADDRNLFDLMYNRLHLIGPHKERRDKVMLDFTKVMLALFEVIMCYFFLS